MGNGNNYNQKHYYQQHYDNTARTFLLKKMYPRYTHYFDQLPVKTCLKRETNVKYKRILITTYTKCLSKNSSLSEVTLTNLIFNVLVFKFI